MAVLSADQLREALQSHTIDVGIGSFELATLSRFQFQAQPLFDCDVKLIFNPDYFPRGKSDAAYRAGKSFDFPTDAGGALCAGLRDIARGAFIAVTACITGKYAPNGTLRCRSDCQSRSGHAAGWAFFSRCTCKPDGSKD
ncbi:hypothetical protein SAMN05216516_101532 [Izhakiella capsodis]|uniref:Uncharacterized protein n=1 Tax=Izhakiella capsodis TaxID=1367852 RepID=A0A1I4V409_9GAMM|nr:hypothetical protein SAMN05216516_101532 [Izhakiella capsodis]